MSEEKLIKDIPIKKDNEGNLYFRANEIENIINEKQQEIERLKEENLLLRASEPMSKLQEDYGYKAEVERLNNILNELEIYINEQIQKSWEIEEQCYEDIESKLQELKGSNKE